MLLCIGELGLQGLAASSDSPKTVYEDHVIALGQLGEVSRLLKLNRIVLMDKVMNPAPAHTTGQIAEFDPNAAQIGTTWQAYVAT